MFVHDLYRRKLAAKLDTTSGLIAKFPTKLLYE